MNKSCSDEQTLQERKNHELFDNDVLLQKEDFSRLPTVDDIIGAENVGKVFGIDTRILVPKDLLNQYPYAGIVKLLLNFQGGRYQGSGFMVAEKTVLTAGHNVFYKSLGQVKSITVKPSFFDSKEDIYVTGIRIASDRTVNSSWDNDWALLRTNCELTKSAAVQYIITVQNCNQLTVNKYQAKIAGYPAVSQGQLTTEMWGADGIILEKEPGNSDKQVIYHKISTSGGQSGAPVLINYNGNLTAVGIHVGGEATKCNYARKIDDMLLSNIMSFGREAERRERAGDWGVNGKITFF